jgi:16S rRNA (uracil1498-N3)-methyltransferase
MDRFYVDAQSFEPGSCIELRGPESHHLRVKRLAPGDRVLVFDGRGREVAAEIVRIGRDETVLKVRAEEVQGAELPLSVVIALPPPKGKRAQVFVEKATELGVAAILPLVTRRAVGPAALVLPPEGGRVEKWRRTTIEAAKQSGVRRLPDILPARSLAEVIADPPPAASGTRSLRLILDPRPEARRLRELLAGPRPESALVLVGPEGGFEDEEVAAAAAAGFVPVRLAPTVLRVETAALAALAAIVVAYE